MLDAIAPRVLAGSLVLIWAWYALGLLAPHIGMRTRTAVFLSFLAWLLFLLLRSPYRFKFNEAILLARGDVNRFRPYRFGMFWAGTYVVETAICAWFAAFRTLSPDEVLFRGLNTLLFLAPAIGLLRRRGYGHSANYFMLMLCGLDVMIGPQSISAKFLPLILIPLLTVFLYFFRRRREVYWKGSRKAFGLLMW